VSKFCNWHELDWSPVSFFLLPSLSFFFLSPPLSSLGLFLFCLTLCTFQHARVYCAYEHPLISRCIFQDNSAVTMGGAAFVADSANLTLGNHVIMSRNTAPLGSAISAVNNGTVTFEGSANITNNLGGPALSMNRSTLVMGEVCRRNS
jgi:hypothetical protein